MSRYLVPLAFAVATLWAWNTNTQGTLGGTRVVVPLVDVIFPAAAGNVELLAERSVWLMAGATALLLLLAVFDHVRAASKRTP